jgi:tetratricopeptide (TPR) repeat protein
LPLPACNPSLAELRSDAWAAEDQGDWDLAARLYRKVLTAQPDDSISRFNLGNVLRHAGQREAAILEFQYAVGQDSGMADAWYNLALVLEESGDQAGTRRALNGAVTADPTYVDALLLLLLFHFGEEEYEACARVCERVILLRVDDGREETAKRALAACRIALAQSKRLPRHRQFEPQP